ncbi:MAG: sigma-70 family RNA polymerase sigma factor [Alphaproteobacteria bacterium]|nr:sigma-70 family RNA polymerase sigma factor [Alphaproteobacteria bacterium]MCB9693117.1 sigma-70 family RNA polymerase sigma factor [Alphaproteobacteria bacterium]
MSERSLPVDAEHPHLALVYDQLRALAARYVDRSPGSTLQPTALVHEAWMKLGPEGSFSGREHFAAVASKAMRQILIDRARARSRAKRGGNPIRTTLAGLASDAPDLDVVDLSRALDELEALDPRGARVVELRWFGGMSSAEAAAHLGVSTRTVEASWRLSRAWLLARLTPAP